MEPMDYVVKEIQGEYAILKNIEDNNEIFIAMHLLPMGTDIGTRLHLKILNIHWQVIKWQRELIKSLNFFI
ncbi:MAG: hypothetical protein J6C16_04190 [Clostridia bacterium]|nr:hypothetical protein [Clostridia bacterium]